MPTANQSPAKEFNQNLIKFKFYFIFLRHTSWAIAEREDLRAEIVLLQLPALPKIPRPHGVVQAARPQTRPIGANINARRTIGVALKLSHQGLIVEIPNGDVAVAAAREANFGVG